MRGGCTDCRSFQERTEVTSSSAPKKLVGNDPSFIHLALGISWRRVAFSPAKVTGMNPPRWPRNRVTAQAASSLQFSTRERGGQPLTWDYLGGDGRDLRQSTTKNEILHLHRVKVRSSLSIFTCLYCKIRGSFVRSKDVLWGPFPRMICRSTGNN